MITSVSLPLKRCLPMALLVLLVLPFGCASESHRTVAPISVATFMTGYQGTKHFLTIGQFHNSSPYMRGIFSDGPDRLGSQTNRFRLLDLVKPEGVFLHPSRCA